MNLFEEILKDFQEARKGNNLIEIETLRLVYAGLKNKIIELKKENRDALEDKEVLSVLNKEAKKRKDAIIAYEKGGRQELADKEKEELKIIEKYLPEKLSEEKIREKIKEVITNREVSDFGPLMGLIMKELGGNADGQLVNKILKEEIS